MRLFAYLDKNTKHAACSGKNNLSVTCRDIALSVARSFYTKEERGHKETVQDKKVRKNREDGKKHESIEDITRINVLQNSLK